MSVGWCSETMPLVEVEGPFTVTVLDDHQGGGYGVPTEEGMAAIRLVARTEGILLDPVYTAKAMAALIANAAAPDRRAAIFLHSGGVPALFAYADELSPGSLM